MSRRRLRIFRVLLPLAAAVGIGLVVWPQAANAQKAPFTTLQMRQSVGADANFGATERGMLDQYFGKFFFPLFKQPVRSDDLANLRKAYKIIVRDIPKTKGHDYLNKLMLDELKLMITRERNTAIKYNAMLLLGELNESDDSSAIKPLPEAFGMLMTVVALKDRPELDYLKPAALVGLARIAQEGAIPKEKAADVTARMLAIVGTKDPPPGMSGSAHTYLRRRAAHVLAAMSDPGADGSVAKALEAMLSDPQASVVTRCELARYIGMLKYPASASAEVERLAGVLGRQAVEMCDAEVGPVSPAGPQGTGGTQKLASRRRIMYALDSSNAGLEGLYASVERGSETQKFIYALRDPMGSLLKALGELDETKEAEVGTIVTPGIDKIKEVLNAKGIAKGRRDGTGTLVSTGSNEAPARRAGAR
jgi:hypothetical protein